MATGEPTQRLSPPASAFALAAAIVLLFNTALACVKDAYAPLSRFMGSLTGHNWTTQGLADVILFLAVGAILTKTEWAAAIAPRTLVILLIASTIAASVALAAWYVFF
ncbi:MAG TPA: hypothetical protein VKS01_03425 [Bryobacteraceae bacterium]|nr:hypothetical protein [Bryobacteraceae bacterium]